MISVGRSVARSGLRRTIPLSDSAAQLSFGLRARLLGTGRKKLAYWTVGRKEGRKEGRQERVSSQAAARPYLVKMKVQLNQSQVPICQLSCAWQCTYSETEMVMDDTKSIWRQHNYLGD